MEPIRWISGYCDGRLPWPSFVYYGPEVPPSSDPAPQPIRASCHRCGIIVDVGWHWIGQGRRVCSQCWRERYQSMVRP